MGNIPVNLSKVWYFNSINYIPAIERQTPSGYIDT
jgi:hypothetical protein